MPPGFSCSGDVWLFLFACIGLGVLLCRGGGGGQGSRSMICV